MSTIGILPPLYPYSPGKDNTKIVPINPDHPPKLSIIPLSIPDIFGDSDKAYQAGQDKAKSDKGGTVDFIGNTIRPIFANLLFLILFVGLVFILVNGQISNIPRYIKNARVV